MNIDKKQLRKLVLGFSIAAIGILVISSLLLVTNTVAKQDSVISPEMVEVAYTRLQNRYGEKNFSQDKGILEMLRKQLSVYKDSDLLKKGFERQQEYREMIIDILNRNGLYTDYIYIAFIESLYDPGAKNKSGAGGMWQLMPVTARSFGLRVNDDIDERLDPEKSTIAAARYLKHLQENFGKDAFTIILAAYNMGEGSISSRALKAESSASAVSFWDLLAEGLIPEQTEAFVLRIITVMILGEGMLPSGEGDLSVLD